MEQINHIEGCDRLITSAKQNGFMHTNCVLLPDEINRYIARGRLFFHRSENGLCLFCDEGSYRILYIFTAPEAELDIPVHDKPLVARIVHREHAQPDPVITSALIKAGFSLQRQTRQLTLRITEELIHELRQRAHAAEFEVQVCPAADADEFMRIRNEFLPYYHFSDLSADELAQRLSDHCHLIVRNQNHDICAIFQSSFSGAAVTPEGLAVKTAYRRRGLGALLMQALLENAFAHHIKRCQMWVDAQNTPAVRLYEKLGFQFPNRCAFEYLLNSTEK
ncbi:MAG: GNAT family N-acetyltransferase [Christensenellales bacterium]